MKESLVAAEVNRTSQGTPSLACMTEVYFDATPSSFRSWDVGRHPLKMALENSEMVVESMIRSCFIHSSVPLRRLSGKECPYWQHIGRDILLRRTSLTVWHLHPTGCYVWSTLFIPTWCSLRTSAVIDVSISRSESNRWITA